MRQASLLRLKPLIVFIITLISTSFTHGQIAGKIDLGKDTISRSKMNGARLTYLNHFRAQSKKATERINLPVEKLKAIMDACAANNISDVSVMVIIIGQNDLAHYRKFNPGASDDQLKGSQMLVFRVPRRAFPAAEGAKINVSNNSPLMMTLLGAGLVLLDAPFSGMPRETEDLFFSFGGICPPPTSCDTEN